jgi:bifunctional enzyme CysN/CysC
VLEALDAFPTPTIVDGLALRFAVQDVYRFDARRIIAGRVESGTLRVGERVRFHPNGEARTVARIVAWPERDIAEAHAGQSIGFVLEDQIFVERGHIAAHDQAPPHVGTGFGASVFWMGHRPLRQGARYRLRLLTQEVECTIVAIPRVLDLDGVGAEHGAPRIERHGVGEIDVVTATPLAFDLHAPGLASGRFVLLDGLDIAGGGIITRTFDADATDRHEAAPHIRLPSSEIATFLAALGSSAGVAVAAETLRALLAPHGVSLQVHDSDGRLVQASDPKADPDGA